MDLDERIENMRHRVMSERTLDSEWLDINSIYEDILCEADKLNIEGNADRGGIVSASNEDKITIKTRDLLKYEGTEFVMMCYRKILHREADSKGLEDHLYLLRSQAISKIELIFYMSESREGKKVDVHIEDGYCKYRLTRLLRKSFKIPVIGRVIRYITKLFRVNRTLYQMMVWNLELQSQVSELQKDNSYLKKEIDGNREEVSQLNERVGHLNEEVDRLIGEAEHSSEENNRLNEKVNQIRTILHNTNEKMDLIEIERLRTIEENLRNNNILIDMHEGIVKNYVDKDKKTLQEIQAELCTIKAAIKNNRCEKLETFENKQKTSISAETINDSYYSIDYFDFENRFRGDREHVKEVQKIYLPYFEGKKRVVDLGCGRGEFVELLHENHIGVKGVDMYQPYVELGIMKDLPIECHEAITFLKEQSSVDGIFVGQVVEHMTIDAIIELCKIAYEKLEKNCYLIIETPNPTSLAIYTEAFYIDPSHNKPVHPKTLQYIVEKEGFSNVEILYTDSSKLPYTIPEISQYVDGSIAEFDKAMKRVSDLLYGSQDYAVIAKK